MLLLLTSVYDSVNIPDHISDSEDEDLGVLSLSPLISTHAANPPSSSSVPRIPSHSTSTDLLSAPVSPLPPQSNISNVEDDSNLQLYLNATDNEHCNASRRGLRKRNFASTHPYLTDQAHYLGLATANDLNEMYMDTQDLEGIVRFLNHVYTKKRQSNHRDHKFRPKNFYAIIGQQSKVAQAKENAELESRSLQAVLSPDLQPITRYLQPGVSDLSDLSDSSESSDYELSQSVSSSLIESQYLESLIPFHKRPHVRAPTPFDSLDESSSGSEDDAIVQVGGKILKEKRVLHGALPESAKRLTFYTSNRSRPKLRPIRVVPEYRKGLAIRKIGTGVQDLARELGYATSKLPSDDFDALRPQSPSQQSRIDTFGVLSSDSDMDVDVHANQQSVPLDHNIPASYWDAQESQQTPREKANVVNSSHAPWSIIPDDVENDVHIVSSLSSSGSESVREQDFVDPMFANRQRHARVGAQKQTKMYASRAKRLLSDKRKRARESSRHAVSDSVSRTTSEKRYRSRKTPAGSNSRQSVIPRSYGMSYTRKRALNIERISFPRLTSKFRGGTATDKTPAKTQRNPIKKQAKLVRSLPLEKESGARNLTEAPAQGKQVREQRPLQTTRTLFRDEYQFTRQPLQYTTTYEAESTRSRETTHQVNTRSFKPCDLELFDASSIVRSVDIQKINHLDQGRTYYIDQNMVTIDLWGDQYTLTLIDYNKSCLSLDHVFGVLTKVLRDPSSFLQPHLFDELYECVRKMVMWLLIAQRTPLDTVRKRLNVVLDLLGKTHDSPSVTVARNIYPFFILIYFICLKLGLSRDPLTQYSTLRLHNHFSEYWLIYLALWSDSAYTSDPVRSIRESESWYTFCNILKCEDAFWSLLDKVLQNGVNLPDAHILMQILHDLSASHPQASHDWRCYYTVYGIISSSQLALDHTRFLQLVSLLHRKHGWNISDQMITALFRTVAGRRFANFHDEGKLPSVLDVVKSRYDIPADTFFEKFMVLLYTHISDSVGDSTSLKRLVRKLLPSSHYQYEPNFKHAAMYINRLNFLLLLQQLTDIDLSSQLYDLSSKILATSDTRLLLATMDGIRVFSMIAIQSGTPIPVNSLVHMLNYINQHYMTLSGILQVWKAMQKLLRLLIESLSKSSRLLQVLKVFGGVGHDYADLLELTLLDLTLDSLARLPQGDLHHEVYALTVFDTLAKKTYNVINTNMGRLPTRNPTDEVRLDALIEKALRIWITCFHLLPPVKWEVLALQIFPYIGNSYLRAKYALCFYKELLVFTPLLSCKDIVILATLHQMCSFTPSKYLPDVIVALRKAGNSIFVWDNKLPVEPISVYNITYDRLRVFSSLLLNIAQANDVPVPTKSLYVREVLRTLSSEYEAHFSNPDFKEFCIGATLATQRLCGSFVANKELMRDCVLKMGISHRDLEMVNWQTVPLKEKLSRLHKELVNSLFFKTDHNEILKAYTFGDGVDLIFHLISIYSRSILVDQQDKWRLLLPLVSFFNENIIHYKFHVRNVSLERFLNMIFGLPCYKMCTRPGDEYSRLSVCIAVSKIFQSMRIMFDGYKDLDVLLSMWRIPILPGAIRLSNAELFSTHSLFDISQSGSDAQLPTLGEPTDDEMMSLRTLLAKELTLNEKLLENANMESQCLPYDLSF